MLALARALTREQRGGDRLGRHHAGQLVGNDGPHQPGPGVVGAALDRRQPGERLNQRVIDRALGIGAAIAKAADRDIDDLRRDLPHHVFAQANALDDAGAHVLDEHIGALQQLLHQIHAALVFGIDRDRALGAIVVQERGGKAALTVRHGAGEVAAAGVLDLDHLGALVGQHHRRQGAGNNAGHVDHTKTCKRAGHGLLRSLKL